MPISDSQKGKQVQNPHLYPRLTWFGQQIRATSCLGGTYHSQSPCLSQFGMISSLTFLFDASLLWMVVFDSDTMTGPLTAKYDGYSLQILIVQSKDCQLAMLELRLWLDWIGLVRFMWLYRIYMLTPPLMRKWRWFSILSRVQLPEWCRDNSVVRENPVRENTTHYTVEYTCKTVLVVSYHALGCERTCIPGYKTWYLYVKDGLSLHT